MKNGIRLLVSLIIGFSITGCTKHPTDPQDPHENFNRAMYGLFNVFDRGIARPAAKVYHAATPPQFQEGVTNAMSNLAEPITFTNDLLQRKINWALIDMTRLLVNSTIGIGGLFDVGSHIGLPKHYNDFDITLAYYSDNKQSPYLILPVIGPMTFRGLISIPAAIAAYPPTYFNPAALSWGIYGLWYVNRRSMLLDGDSFIDDAFDPYVALREAYLSYRNRMIQTALTEGDYNAKTYQGTEYSEDGVSGAEPSYFDTLTAPCHGTDCNNSTSTTPIDTSANSSDKAAKTANKTPDVTRSALSTRNSAQHG